MSAHAGDDENEGVSLEESIEVPQRCIASLGKQLGLEEEAVKEEFEEQLKLRAVETLPLEFVEDCIGDQL